MVIDDMIKRAREAGLIGVSAQLEQERDEALQAMNDLLTTGTGVMLDGKRVDPVGMYKPVAWMHTNGVGHVYFRKKPQDKVFNPQPVYTAAPQRKPLTIAEVEQILAQHNYEIHGDRARYIVRMTEAAHGVMGNSNAA